MLGLIFAIIVGVYFIIETYKSTTNKLILEYHEAQSLQELKITFSKLKIVINEMETDSESTNDSVFFKLISDSKQDLVRCKSTMSSAHDLSLLFDLEEKINKIQASREVFNLQLPRYKSNLKGKMYSEIIESLNIVNVLIDEVQEEIIEYEEKSKTAILHGSSTVVSVGSVLILMLSLVGVLFVRNLTKPIKELVNATKKISEGKYGYRVQLTSGDEFQTLSDSFDKMLDIIESTTVSKEYLDKIINNMFDPLLVTDRDCIIRSVNTATSLLLGYAKSDLEGKNIMFLFQSENPERPHTCNLSMVRDEINQYKHFSSKTGRVIPAGINCSLLNNKEGVAEGLIIVGHDLTEMKEIESKFEQNRRESLIAINEAQEEERMRIATDIHDGLGQILTAISYSVQNLEEGINNSNEAYQKVQSLIDTAIHESKDLAHNLIPIVLKDFGLIVAIQNLIDKANQIHTTNFRFHSYDLNNRLDTKLEKAIFRICQESLNNIIKHANANNANFQIFGNEEGVVLVVDDDGVGFDTQLSSFKEGKSGIGLLSIRERVASFNGTFTIDSKINNGTELIVEIPCLKNQPYANS
jgi:PAS domain S-box-containing protein